MIATPIRNGRPVYPIACPICGRLLGSYYRAGLSLVAYAVPCSEHCVRLWGTARRRRAWRMLPMPLRQAQLAAIMLEEQASESK